MMKQYFLFFFCFLSADVLAQTQSGPATASTFTTEDIEFSSAGVTLAGTIFKPQHPRAALILVHGSGQEKRMMSMASALAGNGFAVLTYDKRGVGKSGGVYVGPEIGTNNIDSANLNLLALDASAAGNTLLAQLSQNHVPMGLMGFSQAGWIIPLAAQKNPQVKFMVVFSGAVVNTLEQLRFQFYTNGNSRFWDTHTEAEAREHISKDPDRYPFVATDPRDALSSLSIPGLWLFGGRDIQVPVQLSIERLIALKAQQTPYEYKLFPELGHNTAFSTSAEPVKLAIKWISSLSN